jgi:hypothetical protein
MTANLDLINQVVEEQAETSIPVYSEITREPEVVPEVITEPEIKRIDSDKDGLFDDTEKELGTDINSPDTDDDGLFDLEEAEVYKTNPLNPDTDGDGFRDGEEVKNGYNPNGSGKLFSLPGNE